MFVVKTGEPMLSRCEGVQSFPTMRDAREAAQAQKGRAPYRCRRCKAWHLDGVLVRDRRYRVRVVG
jgi:hypothetical protein